MTDAERVSYSKLVAKLGPGLCDEEWAYFQEYTRYFKSNPVETRYGILIMGSIPREENMLYAKDPGALRIKHLESLTHLGTGSVGHQQRKFINWLEKLEGKQ